MISEERTQRVIAVQKRLEALPLGNTPATLLAEILIVLEPGLILSGIGYDDRLDQALDKVEKFLDEKDRLALTSLATTGPR